MGRKAAARPRRHRPCGLRFINNSRCNSAMEERAGQMPASEHKGEVCGDIYKVIEASSFSAVRIR